MNNIPPTSPVFRQSYQFLHCQSSPFLYVAQPVCSRSSSFPISRHCALLPLHDVFLQAYSLSSHDVSEVTKFSFFYRLLEYYLGKITNTTGTNTKTIGAK